MTGAGARLFKAKISVADLSAAISMPRFAEDRTHMVEPLQAPAQGIFSGPQLGTGNAYSRPPVGFHHHIRQPEMPPGNVVGGLSVVTSTHVRFGHGTPPVGKPIFIGQL